MSPARKLFHRTIITYNIEHPGKLRSWLCSLLHSVWVDGSAGAPLLVGWMLEVSGVAGIRSTAPVCIIQEFGPGVNLVKCEL